MKDVIVERVNAAMIRIYTEDEGIRKSIHEHFTYKEPGFVKNKWTKWNGDVKLFKLRGNLLPYGCLQMLLELCRENGWSYELDTAFASDISKVTKAELNDWIETLQLRSDGIPIEPYDYQRQGLYLGIKYNRMVILAATSAGKSLIAYMLTRYYEMLSNEDGKKILILVPSQMLCDQMYNDFQDYSSANGWPVRDNCHVIMEGRPKNANKMVYISTWQSIYEEDEEYFKQFGRIINDETHLASGKSISRIMDCSTNAYQRVGMTGTLKAEKIHPILVMSLFGPIQRVVTTKQLIDAGRATEVNIKMIQLNYPTEECEYVTSVKYQDEIDFLIKHRHRAKVMAALAASVKGNTLMMFDRLEHIELVRLELEKLSHGKQVYVITGAVDRDERMDIKAIAEREDGVIVLGTAGCVSTGLSIKKLRNLIFAHPSKSIIRVLQAVGRILRLHDEKGDANVYDFVDNFSFEGKPNYALKHAMERWNIYKEAEMPVSFKKIEMNTSTSILTP
jgi:superfamily II DNA or RNA helicase